MGTSRFVVVQEGTAVRVCRDVVRLRTASGLEFVDLTERVAERVRRSGIRDGIVVVQSRHTTASILVNENESLLLQDLEDLLNCWAPPEASYRHNDLQARVGVPAEERPNGHAHAQALLLGTSVTLNVTEGRIDLGEWQSVFLVELDGPRDRSVSVQVLGVPRSEGNDRS